MKHILLSMTAILLLGSGDALAQLSCDPRSGTVGELACKDPAVKSLVRQIGLEASRPGCAGPKDHELKSVQRGWGWRQYQCSASSDMRACVLSSLQSELDYFRPIKGCDIAAHPVRFDVTVPSYVLAHPAVFVGRDVSVNGEIDLADCAPGTRSVTGRVHEFDYKKAAIEIRFKTMPDAQRGFLCKRPLSAWRGTVRLTNRGVPYLYATDILGAALP